jgi:hypothetical protein
MKLKIQLSRRDINERREWRGGKGREEEKKGDKC